MDTKSNPEEQDSTDLQTQPVVTDDDEIDDRDEINNDVEIIAQLSSN